jgi:hypothetical protein
MQSFITSTTLTALVIAFVSCSKQETQSAAPASPSHPTVAKAPSTTTAPRTSPKRSFDEAIQHPEEQGTVEDWLAYVNEAPTEIDQQKVLYATALNLTVGRQVLLKTLASPTYVVRRVTLLAAVQNASVLDDVFLAGLRHAEKDTQELALDAARQLGPPQRTALYSTILNEKGTSEWMAGELVNGLAQISTRSSSDALVAALDHVSPDVKAQILLRMTEQFPAAVGTAQAVKNWWAEHRVHFDELLSPTN